MNVFAIYRLYSTKLNCIKIDTFINRKQKATEEKAMTKLTKYTLDKYVRNLFHDKIPTINLLIYFCQCV